ncbi:MAG: 16S rRNA (guanine(527)-N(7))-methyltransferase RsmG [Gammaproteobacteria bacterium]|nr:16S rRNA (guanine(527)-N(7))-methyltransferase RsmG [Gammaproteobacteria bacterium]
MTQGWQQRLDDGLAELDIPAATAARDALADYLALLVKWNRAFNLTAVRDPAEMVTRHLLDSLAVLEHVGPGAVCDVGTGPGLPGIPLALVDRDRPVTLLDSNIKKTRFCRQAATELGLDNIDVVHARVEDYRPEEGFATVISRAFASLVDFVETSRHLVAARGVMLAMKGTYPETELADLPSDVEVAASHRLRVPGLDAERHLMELRPRALAAPGQAGPERVGHH